jgi:hypothetical protein
MAPGGELAAELSLEQSGAQSEDHQEDSPRFGNGR